MIGTRDTAAKIVRGVGGKAFPADFNWICNICGYTCRAFELTCSNCEWRDRTAKIERTHSSDLTAAYRGTFTPNTR